MKTEKVTIEITYGSKFQEEAFSDMVFGTISRIGEFIHTKHKNNKVLINDVEIKL